MAPAKLGLTIVAVLACAAAGYVAIAPSCTAANNGPAPIGQGNTGPDTPSGQPGPTPPVVPGATEPGDPVPGLPPEPARIPDTLDVTLDGRTFTLELALNGDQRLQGLSDRRSIADDGGMLFVYTEDDEVLAFVMRRCHVPIDIIFMDGDGRIVQTHHMPVIRPIGSHGWYYPRGSYPSRVPAQFAIELKGGTLETLDLSIGEAVDLPLDDLKARAR